MRRTTRLRLGSVLGVLLLLTTAAVGIVSAQPQPAAAAAPTVTGAGQPGTAQLALHFTRDQSSTPVATTAQLVQAASRKQIEHTRLNAQDYAAAKAIAQQSAPRGPNQSGGGNEQAAASFPGMQSSPAICPPVGCNPPDMGLAASPNWVFQGVNTSFSVFTPSGVQQPGWPKTITDFFGVPNPGACAGNVPFVSDPRAFYDVNTGRFWAAALEVEGAFGVNNCPFITRYWIAVSQTHDPRGVWNVYAFDMSLGTTNAADYTQFGFDARGIYFSANMFTQDGSAYAYAEIFGADKAAMQRGQAVNAPGFSNLTVTGPAGTFLVDTVNPVLTIARGNGPGTQYFAQTFNGYDPVTNHSCLSAADACVGLGIWGMTWSNGGNDQGDRSGGNGLGAPSLSFAYVGNTKAYTFAPSADQPGCIQCLDSLDLRVTGTPVYRDGSIYVAWGSGIDNGTQVVPGIVWSQVTPRTHNGRLASATQRAGDYYFFGGDTAATFPSLMPDGQGRLYMLFYRMGATIFPESRVTVRRGNGHFATPGTLVKAGEAPYRPGVCGVLFVCRWGDYSAMSYDGFESNTVWYSGQYANASGFRANWGTWIGSTQ